MSRIVMAFILALVGACARTADDASPQQALTSVIGTPFVIAFKVPACAVTLGVAAPAAGALELAQDDPREQTLRQALDDGITRNCGPPYAIAP